MVYISRIVLQGFKSFADRVAIPLTPGFNVICGPNGSGKSNLVEAILFALGVYTARQIRASRLQELIFHGSKKRKPASYCVVSLYLNNKDKKLPGEEEIKISRKVTSKGISIFRLNGKVVTRSKLLDFLANANISPYGFNIIMQGDITKLIEMSPVERREIIDQLAGISEFEEKRKRALSELEKVERHLDELNIVIREKQAIVEKLKRDCELAKRARELEREIKLLRAKLLLLEIKEKEASLLRIESELEAKEGELTSMTQVLKQKESELRRAIEESEKLSEELLKATRDYELRREIDKVRTALIEKKHELLLLERELESLNKPSELAKRLLELGIALATLSQVMKIPREYELAIRAAIGHRMNDLIVKDEEAAIKCIEFLRKQKLGVARFLPLTSIEAREIQKPKVGKLAIEVVDFEKRYESVVKHVLGDLVIVDDIGQARELRGYRVVSLSGDVKEKSGEYVGGYRKVKEIIERRVKLMERTAKLRSEIEELELRLSKLKEREAKELEVMKEIEEKRKDVKKEFDRVYREVVRLRSKRDALRDRIATLRAKKARIEAEKEARELELRELGEVVEEARASIKEGESSKEIKARLKKAIRELHKLGPINMRAESELKVVENELRLLCEKRDRIAREREAILKTIEEIESKRYEKFMETLNEISKHFASVYRDLMGGEAKLRLEEEGNLESGLLIEASKPGKKFLNIDAMSGGEKTLTAIAFLFALQRYRKQPFYILDEIDATLDKVNAKKVANFIKKHSRETQFIVVTHNDITISHADAVFGVAMQDGASKVFSIRMPGR